MALFNRKKNNDVLPQEVQDYYQAERRQRTGTAWFLAIVTLLTTIVIAAALFFAGRWVYRHTFGKPDKTTPAQVETNKTQNKGTSPTSGTANSNPQTSSTNTTASPTPSTTTNRTPATTPNTGPSATELVNTGPSDEE